MRIHFCSPASETPAEYYHRLGDVQMSALLHRLEELKQPAVVWAVISPRGLALLSRDDAASPQFFRFRQPGCLWTNVEYRMPDGTGPWYNA